MPATTMEREFSSKIVLITGASTGIGAGIAKSFAKCKASLAITGRNEANLQTVSDECTELGATQVLSVSGDMEKKDDIEMIIRKTTEKYGKIDILVNNAGICDVGGISEITWERFDQIIQTNVKSAVFMTQMALPYLEESKGNVIIISSMLSEIPSPLALAYSLSKSALDQFTKTTALELSKEGIRVNSVNPGYCFSNLFRFLEKSEDEIRGMIKQLSLDNPLESKEVSIENITDAVLILTSNAASMITGACLKVDGGRCLIGKM